jgi:hypothetical protein
VVSVAEVPGSIPGHSLGFFWGSWVWNGVHSASWSDKLSCYLNKEVTVRFVKLKMQLRDSMYWPHVNPVPPGAVGKDCQRRLLSRPRLVRAVAPRIIIDTVMLTLRWTLSIVTMLWRYSELPKVFYHINISHNWQCLYIYIISNVGWRLGWFLNMCC